MLDWTEAKVVASQDQRQSRLRLGSDIPSEIGHGARRLVRFVGPFGDLFFGDVRGSGGGGDISSFCRV